MLKQLIDELCPHGVKISTLGEIATDMYRGSGITRAQLTDAGTPCVRYGEIYTTYGPYFHECVSFTDPKKISNKKYFSHGDILFAITGENVEEISKSTAYLGNEVCLAGGDLVVMKHDQDPKYLAFALSTTDAQLQKSKGKVKSKVVHSSVPDLKRITVPLPPIIIQNEIVRILDKFILLKAELEAELEARTVQYRYYRDALLDMFFGVKGINLKLIDDLINEFSPYKFKSFAISDVCVDVENIRWSENRDDVYSYIDLTSVDRDTKKITNTIEISFEDAPCRAQQIVKKDDVIYGTTRPTLQRYCIIPEEFDGQICSTGYSVLRSNKNMILPKFLYYLVSTKKFDTHVERYQRGSAYPAISDKDLKMFKIDLPPIPVQKAVVEILDRFETLVQDLQDGLPGEIALRQKQYEYYRDQLLSFKALKSEEKAEKTEPSIISRSSYDTI